ncbi:Aste57867_569 [Aphanomyces stellatus]|uniref:Aste57867_569 protein n=1 Tax=Aphanomyces stellatus TaxID=120398 RepID=A0A485K855_9STRA|nr:hypothetical protein As57867_000568 [Aphanomyces stellatus]VFT77794.1 Aste57867_569 [Aphanomyces stellatus]
MSILAVLAATDLVGAITAYQPGLPAHLTPLATILCTACAESTSFLVTKNYPGFESNLAVFAPVFRAWLVAHGPAALPRLFHWLPHLQPMVVAYAAAVPDSAALLVYLHATGRLARQMPPIMDQAALSGQLHVMLFLDAVDMPGWRTWTMDIAASRGQLALVQFLHHGRREGCTTTAMDAAAGGGHLDVLHFLHVQRTEGCTVDAMDRAAAAGHLDTVVSLHVHRTEGCTQRAMDRAASNGHLHVVQFLHAHRTEGCTTHAMDAAACMGHWDVVRFLHAHRTEGCTPRAMTAAATKGQLDVVQLLYEERTVGRVAEALEGALSHGQWNVVRYFHANLEARGLPIPPRPIDPMERRHRMHGRWGMGMFHHHDSVMLDLF